MERPAPDLFISHVEEDFGVASALAARLGEAGYSSWYYERDSSPGASYLLQTREAIVSAQAVILLISRGSLSSHQITKEVVRAHESHRPIVPLLLGVSDAEYKRRQPEWEEAVGAATSVSVPPEGIEGILPRVIRGLEKLGIAPSGSASQSSPPQLRASQAGAAVPNPARVPLAGRVLIAGGIAAFVLLAGLFNFMRALAPAVGSDESNLYLGFPTVRSANLFANGVNAGLGAVILFALWKAYQVGTPAEARVRTAGRAMFGVSLLWLVWVLGGTLGAANWVSVSAANRSAFLGGVMTIGLLSLLFPGVILLLYRK